MNINSNIILASASPRRQQLLKLIFPEFSVFVSDIEEAIPEKLKHEDVPEFLAKSKALCVSKKFPNDLVIGADTCVLINNEILGKPHSPEKAYAMLQKLSGKVHKVITGCAIVYNGICTTFSVSTDVEFFELSEEQINDYIRTDEPYDKAGGYGIQSKGSLFVKAIKGDYYNVVGFPISELNRRLMQINVISRT